MQPNPISSRQKLLARPVLVPPIWQISPYNQRDLLLLQLLGRNLQRIRHALDIDQHRRISTVNQCQPSFLVSTSLSTTYLICSALVPSTRARSYFVMYGVVVRLSLSTLLSFVSVTVFFASPLALAAALGSPDATMLSSGSWASGSSAPLGSSAS